MKMIEKLKLNRNVLGSHIQIEKINNGNLSASELKLSPNAHRSIYSWVSDDKYVNIQSKQNVNISSKLNEQRYHYEDLNEDIPVFKKMIDEFTDIVNEINNLVYLHLNK